MVDSLSNMRKEQKWWVYIIKTKKNRLYTGITTSPQRRFEEHKTKKGAKFFYSDTPLKIVYLEIFKNRSEASKREAEIKSLKRIEKEILIKKFNALIIR